MKKKNVSRRFPALLAGIASLALLFAGCSPDPEPDPDPSLVSGSYTVSFNANGGSPAPQAQQVNAGRRVTEPDSMTKAGNLFNGWYKEEGLESKWDFAKDTVTAAITLYAKWIPGSGSVAELEAFLADTSGGDSADAPLTAAVGVELSATNWSGILSALNTADKYVSLNLAACAKSTHSSGGGLYTDGYFDPNSDDSTGKDWIVSLVLPDAAAKIASGNTDDPTFKGFTSLTSISGAGVTGIGQVAFSGCSGLTSVSFPQATYIGSDAFKGCSDLISASFPAAAGIGESAFSGCTALTSFVLTGTGALSTIEGGKALVRNNTELVAYPSATNITLETITSIGKYAFCDCSGLTSVSFLQATTIGEYAFYGCSALNSVSFPAAVTIGNVAFAECSNLTSVSFPQATTIGNGAFAECSGLTSVSFPVATTIGSTAFYGCSDLNSVSFPQVASIGEWAFEKTGTASLTIILGSTPPKVGRAMFDKVTESKNVTVKYPAGTSGYGEAPTDTTSNNWGNAFRGKGWNGSVYNSYSVNENITLTYQTYTL